MTFFIIIFLISILFATGMLFFRAWEIRTSKIEFVKRTEIKIPELPFRHFEKNMLYFIKHIIQGLILVSVKYWFILLTKLKKWFNEKWPKINDYFKKKTNENTSYRHSFLKKALLELKAKIKHIREKVREEFKESDEEKIVE